MSEQLTPNGRAYAQAHTDSVVARVALAGRDSWPPMLVATAIATMNRAGAERAARDAGRDHGSNAASWYFNGNTSAEEYRATLRAIEDGSLSEWPPAPLSGEWAGEPTPASVLADLEVSEDDPAADDILTAYEDGYYEEASGALERECRSHVEPADAAYAALDADAAYSVADSPGIAWHIAAPLDASQVWAVMIGDDARHAVDIADLTPIGEDDYCAGCGQIGCGWH